MNTLLLTAHDFRTPRKANMHFIASELAKRGPMRFFSLRYSGLSRWTHDARRFLDGRANRVEHVDGVDCFLWKTMVHPFNTRRRALRPVENLMFRASVARPPPTLVRWMREADTIFFESGSAVLFADLARQANPRARRIYIASDDLETIGVADFVKRRFAAIADGMDALCLPSVRLADGMPSSANRYFVPHGIDRSIAERADPNPYDTPDNAVSVGSMLFDPGFFEQAAPAFPDVTFHVIGSGRANRDGFPPNVRVYDEMPFDDTLRYIKHARFGIAPYRAADVPAYLIDTSMKMMQYRFFGLPAVCPTSVTGGAADRFGYTPGSAESIRTAIGAALVARRTPAGGMLSWSEVTDRLLDPSAFADTRMPGSAHETAHAQR